MAPGDEQQLPSGVVTFLFTDVEGSTQLWAADTSAMGESLRVHDGIVRSAVEDRGGFVFTTAGDSFAVAFAQASAAVVAAPAMARRAPRRRRPRSRGLGCGRLPVLPVAKGGERTRLPR